MSSNVKTLRDLQIEKFNQSNILSELADTAEELTELSDRLIVASQRLSTSAVSVNQQLQAVDNFLAEGRIKDVERAIAVTNAMAKVLNSDKIRTSIEGLENAFEIQPAKKADEIDEALAALGFDTTKK